MDGLIIDGVIYIPSDNIGCDKCAIKNTKYCRNHGKICVFFSNRGFVRYGLSKKSKSMCVKDKTKQCNLCHECDIDVLNPNY